MRVLNIAVHSGGGVGTVLKNFLENDTNNVHTLACLNPYDARSEKICVPTFHDLRNDMGTLDHLVNKNDVVILHWYNNPLLFELLINNGLPPCRLAVWAHASCLHAPYVLTPKLVHIADRVVLTSPITYHTQEYEKLSDRDKTKFSIVWSVADMEPFKQVDRSRHATFNVGYVGTVDFAKLHPEFVDMCAEINIPNVKFLFCSSGPDLDTIKQQVHDRGLEDKFEFVGQQAHDDLPRWYAQMDVFGYPLSPTHFGTCEQVIGEAMCAGAIPVVLNNPAEDYIIGSDGSCGLMATRETYASKVEMLYLDEELRNRLADNVCLYASTLYDTAVMLDRWNKEFERMVREPKHKIRWPHSGSEIFKESLGDLREVFDRDDLGSIEDLFEKNPQWHSPSKGSIIQYQHAYPEDAKLAEWKKLI